MFSSRQKSLILFWIKACVCFQNQNQIKTQLLFHSQDLLMKQKMDALNIILL